MPVTHGVPTVTINHDHQFMVSDPDATLVPTGAVGFFARDTRFVSGYSIQLRPDQKPLEGPAGVTVDCTDLHAWAEAWVERWRSFDIAHDIPVGEAHIKLAVGADYLDACPVRGVRVGGGAETLFAEAHVEATQQ